MTEHLSERFGEPGRPDLPVEPDRDTSLAPDITFAGDAQPVRLLNPQVREPSGR